LYSCTLKMMSACSFMLLKCWCLLAKLHSVMSQQTIIFYLFKSWYKLPVLEVDCLLYYKS
jgi:hypothetical protein